MSSYFIAYIDITDQQEYDKYLAGVDAVFQKFNGTYLAVDRSPVALEGSPPPGRVVLIRFPSREDLMKWYNSEEYQAIVKHRLKAASCHTSVVQGVF